MSQKKIIRIDIETAPLRSSEEEMPLEMMKVWKEKYCSDQPESMTPREWFRERSTLFPEFSRIVCVSMGYEKNDFYDRKFVTKSCFGYDERSLLDEVIVILSKFDTSDYTLGGHNINGFDLWFLRKRMVITWMRRIDNFPPILDTLSKKPRELDYVDTMLLFQMGKPTSTSLAVMCLSLGVSSPKGDMDGTDVKDIFYGKNTKLENKIKKMDKIRRAEELLKPTEIYSNDMIVSYCEKDIYATYSCYCKVYGLEILPMDGYKPFIDEECKKEFDWHGEDSIPLWAFVSLTGIEKPYLSPSDSKLFKDFLDRYTQRNKERNALILSRNSIHKW